MYQGLSVGSDFRLPSHVLLCAVIAIGNLPAWIHAGDCSHDHACSAAHHAAAPRCCKAICQEDEPRVGYESAPGIKSAPETQTRQELTHCILCQSIGGRKSGLITDCGLTVDYSTVGVVNLHYVTSSRSNSCLVPHPRGPPRSWAYV